MTDQTRYELNNTLNSCVCYALQQKAKNDKYARKTIEIILENNIKVKRSDLKQFLDERYGKVSLFNKSLLKSIFKPKKQYHKLND